MIYIYIYYSYTVPALARKKMYNGVVLRSGRVSDNMAVFLSYTTEDR